MERFIKYPSTPNFKNIIKTLQEANETVPLLWTVKIHGTNSSVSYDQADGSLEYYSRRKILSLEEDNHGFMRLASSPGMQTGILLIIKEVISLFGRGRDDNVIHIFGEFFGKGIHSEAVGACKVEGKKWAIFRIMVNGNILSHYELALLGEALAANKTNKLAMALSDNKLDSLALVGIHFVYEFGIWMTDYDPSEEMATVELYDKINKTVKEVGESCPVAKSFGVDGIGEGVVVSSSQQDIIFKIKSPLFEGRIEDKLPFVIPEHKRLKHERVVKVVREIMPLSRLTQCIEEVNSVEGYPSQPNVKLMGKYIQWMLEDIKKENVAELEEAELSVKDLNSEVAKTIRSYVTSNESVGI